MAYTVGIANPRRVANSFATATAITPTDNTPIGPFQAFMVNGSGSIVVVPVGQTSPVTITVTGYTMVPLAIQGVQATGTTVTGTIYGMG